MGPEGKPGTNGTNGTSVTSTKVNPGNQECAEGGSEFKAGGTKTYACNGSPWTAGGTLPAGSTETGNWIVQPAPAKAAEEPHVVDISFPIPLKTAFAPVFVKANAPTTPEHCKGSSTNPGAEPGYLCIFEVEGDFYKGGLTFAAALETGYVGAQLVFGTTDPKTPGEEEAAEGTFAVTAG